MERDWAREKLAEVAHQAYSEALAAEDGDFAENVYCRVLERELLPLLWAGEGLRENEQRLENHYHPALRRISQAGEAWDAAKAAKTGA